MNAVIRLLVKLLIAAIVAALASVFAYRIITKDLAEAMVSPFEKRSSTVSTPDR